MLITLNIPNPPKKQEIIEIPLHFCGGKVVEAGGFEFEEHKATGRWMLIGGRCRCTECMKPAGKKNDDSSWLSKFCPNCGVKMEGSEEG